MSKKIMRKNLTKFISLYFSFTNNHCINFKVYSMPFFSNIQNIISLPFFIKKKKTCAMTPRKAFCIKINEFST